MNSYEKQLFITTFYVIIKTMIRLFEDEQTELKKTTGELSNAMIDIAAILNKHGRGKLFFGLNNDGSNHKFDISDSTLRDVSRKIYESIKPQIYPNVYKASINEGSVIVVEFSGSDTPYSAFGRYYTRVADENREMTPDQLRHIMTDKEYEVSWEERPSNELLSEIDSETIMWFSKSGIECGRLPEAYYSDESLLLQLGLVKDGHLNNAGRVLFSKNRPVVLKMAVFATNQKLTFLDINRAEGNVFQLIDKGLKYISENMRWRVEVSGLQRDEIPEIPLDALREIIVNCFAHAQYNIGVQHEIDIFPDRISITNPGCFANSFTPKDYFEKNNQSVLRNKLIANALFRCKKLESFGSGLKKVGMLCEDCGVFVDYDMGDNYFTFSFKRKNVNVVNNVVKNVVLNETEMSVLALLRKDGRNTAETVARQIGKSTRTAQRVMDSLKTNGLVARRGNKKTGYWEVL